VRAEKSVSGEPLVGAPSPCPLPIGWGEGGRRPGEGIRAEPRKLRSELGPELGSRLIIIQFAHCGLEQLRDFSVKCSNKASTGACTHSTQPYVNNMIPKRGLRYCCALIWRQYLLGLPAIFFEAATRRFCPCEIRKGFRILDPWTDTRHYTSTLADAAVHLIAECEPIRFKRVRAEIRSIVNALAIAGSTYGRPLRVCSVDFRYSPDDQEMAVKLLAAALIREATVGHLVSRGVLRIRRNRLRFDRLCCEEARRFLQRLGMTSTPYDPECLTTLPRDMYWRLAAKEIHGVLVRNPAKEANISKKGGAAR